MTTESIVLPVTKSADIMVVEMRAGDDWKLLCDEENPKSVKKWREETGGRRVINAGFFDERFSPVGFVHTAKKTWGNIKNHPAMLWSDGKKYMLTNNEEFRKKIDTLPPDVWVTSGFPVLVWDKKTIFERETKKYARRTGVLEKNGHLFLYVSVRGEPSLHELAIFLQSFGAEKALNLDGGTSTGFSSDFREVPSFPVPCVLVQY